MVQLGGGAEDDRGAFLVVFFYARSVPSSLLVRRKIGLRPRWRRTKKVTPVDHSGRWQAALVITRRDRKGRLDGHCTRPLTIAEFLGLTRPRTYREAGWGY